MSAFHVSDTHINALLSWARINNPIVRTSATRYDLSQSEDYWRVGAILRECNNASMDARYNDAPQGFLPARVDVKRLFPINVVAACDCFDYQACEYSGWEESDGKRIIEQIKGAAIRRVAGYEKVWSISEEFLQGATA